MTDQLPDMPQPAEWLSPKSITFRGQFHGQQGPPQWHSALCAVLAIRPSRDLPSRDPYHAGYLAALHDVHDTIARNLLLTR